MGALLIQDSPFFLLSSDPSQMRLLVNSVGSLRGEEGGGGGGGGGGVDIPLPFLLPSIAFPLILNKGLLVNTM